MANKKGIEAGRAYVKAYLDDSAIGRGLKRMRATLESFSAKLASIGTKLVGVGTGLAGVFALPVKRAAMLELLTADLEILVGSTEKATKLIADFRKFAAETPLEFMDVAELGRQMLTFRLATEDNVIETLRKIGDGAGGIPERIKRVTIALGQMRGKGRIQSQEMMQLTEAGIPAWELLAQVLGTDVAGAMEMVEGRMVDAASTLPKLINEIGRFGGGRMARMADTLIGRFSALKDALWEAVTPLGEALLPHVGKLLTLASMLADRLGPWIKANAQLAVKTVAVAAALVVLGSAALGLSVALRTAALAVSGVGMAIRVVLFPATIAVTAAIRVLQGVVNIAAGAMAAARASVALLAASLHAMGIAAGAVSAVLSILGIGMKLFRSSALLTRAALAVAAAATYAFRGAIMAAQAATILIAGSLKLLAAGLTILSVVLGLLASGPVAVAVALVALGAAIYAAYQSGIRFGDVVDWLKARLGPLAAVIKEVFASIHDSLMAGDWSAAAKTMWAAIQLAFAHGTNWIVGKWLEAKASLASAFIDLAATLEKVWARLSDSIARGAAAAASAALGIAAAAAEKLGQTETAMSLRLLSAGFTTAGIAIDAGTQNKVDEIEQRRQQTQATLAEDAARERAATLQSTADEEQALAAAIKHSARRIKEREEAERRRQEIEADIAERIAKGDSTNPLDGAAAGAIKTAQTTAVNTAAFVGSTEGMESVLRATQGFGRNVTPGEKVIADKLDVIAEGIDGLVDKAVIITEGTTA